MKQQVFIIGGGSAFDTHEAYIESLKKREVSLEKLSFKDWKGNLPTNLGDSFEVYFLQMPNRFNARYLEWKIWFEKYVPYMQDNCIFVGHSLGGVFFAKYLSEEILQKKVRATFLVAAPYNTATNHPYVDFNINKPLTSFESQGGQIFLYQSRDDQSVPFSNLADYVRELPNATVRIFDNRGHFNDEQFPEIVEDIKYLTASVPPLAETSWFCMRPVRSIASCPLKYSRPGWPGWAQRESRK